MNKILNNRFLKPLFIVLGISIIILTLDEACISKLTTGLPCPGCGSTRAALALINFDFKAYFHYNPLLILTIIIIFISVYKVDLILNYKKVFISILLIYLIFYIYRMILYFPNIEPMDYNSKSLVCKLYNFIIK